MTLNYTCNYEVSNFEVIMDENLVFCVQTFEWEGNIWTKPLQSRSGFQLEK